jgi:hypothetical protein
MGQRTGREETTMSETVGHSPDRAISGTAHSISGPIVLLILAVTPQLFHFLTALGFAILGMATKNPLQVLGDHIIAFGTALRWLGWAITFLPDLIPAAIQALVSWQSSLLTPVFAKIGGAPTDAWLPLIYSYPLLIVAALSFVLKPRCTQDYYGGIALMALALFALWASSDLQGTHGFSFGAGTAPRMFGTILLLLGAAVALIGFATDGPNTSTYHWRGPVFVMLSIVSFAVTIRSLGLVFSAFASFMIAALGTAETKWLETFIVCVCLTAFCCVLFPYGLGLPMPLWPRFLNW